jgi:hypothetical protein
VGFYKDYLEAAYNKDPNEDLLMDGNLWPDLVKTSSFPHKAVFLVDTSAGQAERLIALRNAHDEKYWMHVYSDEGLVKWAEMNTVRSRLYRKQCARLGYRYFDIAEHGIDGVGRLAFDSLTIGLNDQAGNPKSTTL